MKLNILVLVLILSPSLGHAREGIFDCESKADEKASRVTIRVTDAAAVTGAVKMGDPSHLRQGDSTRDIYRATIRGSKHELTILGGKSGTYTISAGGKEKYRYICKLNSKL
jgi:hypothetical protein